MASSTTNRRRRGTKDDGLEPLDSLDSPAPKGICTEQLPATLSEVKRVAKVVIIFLPILFAIGLHSDLLTMASSFRERSLCRTQPPTPITKQVDKISRAHGDESDRIPSIAAEAQTSALKPTVKMHLLAAEHAIRYLKDHSKWREFDSKVDLIEWSTKYLKLSNDLSRAIEKFQKNSRNVMIELVLYVEGLIEEMEHLKHKEEHSMGPSFGTYFTSKQKATL